MSKKTPPPRKGKRRGKSARSASAAKGWQTRRAVKLKRSRAALLGWARRRAKEASKRGEIDTAFLLAELVDRTEKVAGAIELQNFREAFHHGAKWHTYTVGLESALDFHYTEDVFRIWRKVLKKWYRKVTILRGRLMAFEDDAKMQAHWYTLVAVQEFKNAFTQLAAELKAWSSRVGPSHATEGIDGFEIQLEVDDDAGKKHDSSRGRFRH